MRQPRHNFCPTFSSNHAGHSLNVGDHIDTAVEPSQAGQPSRSLDGTCHHIAARRCGSIPMRMVRGPPRLTPAADTNGLSQRHTLTDFMGALDEVNHRLG
jgi:hypothetical protein